MIRNALHFRFVLCIMQEVRICMKGNGAAFELCVSYWAFLTLRITFQNICKIRGAMDYRRESNQQRNRG